MERLTSKFKSEPIIEFSNENQICVNRKEDEKGVKSYYSGKPIEKLGQFEDFMEEFNYDSIIQLANDLKEAKVNSDTCAKLLELSNKELQTYKKRWEKLKAYACKHFEEDEGGVALGFKKILNKMQELEKDLEGKDEVW